MVNVRQKMMREINKKVGSYEILSLIYHPEKEVERDDVPKIKRFLEKIRKRAAILILSGIGGETNAGRKLAIIFRKKFSNGFLVLIPSRVCSCLTYIVLISNGVIVSENSYITPIDPIFTYQGKQIRAAVGINSSNWRIVQNSHKHLNDAARFCCEILNQHGCILIDPRRLNMNTLKRIARYLIFPKDHSIPIKHADMKKMNFKCIYFSSNSKFWKIIEEMYAYYLFELINSKKRFIIENKSSYEIY